jgi:hypothetical protein
MKGYNKKPFILSLLIVVIFTCLLTFPQDDALRHVGLAFANSKHAPISIFAVPTVWGKVYPYSYFEVFKDYDPWFGYDLILKTIATGLKSLPISTLLSQFLLIKMLSLLFSLAFFYLILARSGILGDIKDRDTFTLAYVILLVLTFHPFFRMLGIRPFAFGALFVVYTIGQKGILKGVLSSATLTFLYPYLAWFYTIPVAFAHFLKGDRKFALGAMSLSILFLYLQPSSFWGFQLALFNSDLVRAAINIKITEFYNSLNLLFFIYLSGFLILYPSLSGKTKKLSFENLLIILYLIPSLKYIRYFLDLILPLLFVSFGREMLKALLEPYRKLTSHLKWSFSFWKNTLVSSLQKLKLSRTRTDRERVNINLKPYLLILYALVSVPVIQLNHKEFSSLRKFQANLSVIPTGSLVLTHFNLQYKILYVRPDLRIIPSCEMGFPKDSIRKEYLEFVNDGEVLPLARKTNARFLLEPKGMYINPQNGKSLRLVKKGKNLKIWKVLHLSE